jgi:sulfur-oxidizing protein SoxY
VQEVLVLADHNPIIKVLQFYPVSVKPTLSFRFKLQQASPVRALARTKDGVWHAGGVWVDAAGGGCTAPSVGRASGSWADTLNQVQTRLWKRQEGERLRVRLMHPMDTGLAPGIPAFYIERLNLSDAAGNELMRMLTFEPVSENPVFSFDLRTDKRPALPLLVSGSDNNGNRIQAKVLQ